MSAGRFHVGLVLVIAGVVLLQCGGCGVRGSVPALMVTGRTYEEAFDTAVEVLRDARFTIDRVDRRHGVITTEARVSSTIVEPWRPDNATVGMSVDSTLNYQRRSIRVEFAPAEEGAEPDVARDLTAVEAEREIPVRVTCTIERAHRPNRRVETTALSRSSQAIDPKLRERGIGALFWEPVARDQYWEQTIRATISSRLAAAPSGSAGLP